LFVADPAGERLNRHFILYAERRSQCPLGGQSLVEGERHLVGNWGSPRKSAR
jgi:hypothetical protein